MSPPINRSRASGRKSRSSRCFAPGVLPDDLYEYYTGEPEPRRSPPPGAEPKTWCVVDDWPERVPVTEAEIEVFERWFGDIFDELFGPQPPDDGLTMLSTDDNKKP